MQKMIFNLLCLLYLCNNKLRVPRGDIDDEERKSCLHLFHIDFFILMIKFNKRRPD